MRVLALERELGSKEQRNGGAILAEEARRVWELEQEEVVREAYFRADRDEAVLVLETPGLPEARAAVDSLPLVVAGTIEFELIPLRPYPGMARLFAKASGH